MKSNLVKNKNFLLLIAGKFISVFGTQIQDFALSLYVLKITGSATKFASVLAVTILPQIILGPICGVFVDWLDRRKLMIVLDIISAAIVMYMGVIYKANGSLTMGYIYFAVIALSVVSLIYSSAAGAVVPCIVEKEELISANSANSAALSVPQIASPLISGLIYGIFGLFPVILINSISFLISALCEVFMNIPKVTKEGTSFNFKQFRIDFKEGLLFIKNKKFILKIAICAFIINFALDPAFSVGLTYIGKRVFLLSDSTMGILFSVSSFGTIAGSILAGVIGKKINAIKAFGYGTSLCGIFTVMIAIVVLAFYSKSLTNILVILLMVGALFTSLMMTVIIINIMNSTLFQKLTPLEMMGRVSSVMGAACTAAMPVGQMLIGGMFDYTPAYIPMMISGIIVIVTGTIFTVSERKNSLEAEAI